MNSRKPRRDDDKKSGGRTRISSPKSNSSFAPRNTDSPKRSYSSGEGSSFEKRPYTKRTEGSNDKPFTRKPFGERNNDDNRTFNKRSEGSSDKPFTRKPYGDRNNDDVEKRSYNKRSEGGSDKPFTRKPYGDRNNEGAEKRPYAKRSEGGSDKPFTRKPYGDRNNEGAEKRPYTKRTSNDFDTRPKFEREGGERNPEERRGARDYGKPYKSKSYSETAKGPYNKNISTGNKKPYTKSKEEDGDPNFVRLNRYLSNAGICSRREADDLIISGVITVNGELVTELGAKVHKETDEVRYNNEPVRKERLQYILMNKPKDFITTTDDPQERRTVTSLVERLTSARVYPVGRLDRNTTGVLILTNDGDLTLRLTHPKFGITKVYAAELDKKLRQEDFIKIKEGLTLEDGEIKVDDVAYIEGMDKNNIGVQLHSGKNRIVRRIFESLGYRVMKLDRTSFASLSKKGLKRGECRFLTPAEVGRLKSMKA